MLCSHRLELNAHPTCRSAWGSSIGSICLAVSTAHWQERRHAFEGVLLLFHASAPGWWREDWFGLSRLLASLACFWAHSRCTSCGSFALQKPPAAPPVLRRLPGSSWFLLAHSGSSWIRMASPGSSWLLLVPPDSSWLLLASPGSSWLSFPLISIYIALICVPGCAKHKYLLGTSEH